MSNLIQLEACFRDVLALPANADVSALAYQEHPSWDSVAHMRLVAAIESTFDIMMETDQILDMSSFAKAVEILAACEINLAA
jgi:acyl carrier protein